MTQISKTEAREFLVGHHGLRASQGRGLTALEPLLAKMRCIQLDPLNPIGTNADLVAMARVDGLKRGDVYTLLGERAFEHWAKERCLLPASAFPYYRDQVVETPWWRLGERHRKLPTGILEQVLAEVRERGAVTARDLEGYGRVEQIDYNGWKSTGRAATLALKVLWTRCQVVVVGRRGKQKLYDLPERAFPATWNDDATEPFAPWALLDRVEAAGLLSTAGGPHWSMLSDVRKSELPARMVAEGELERVTVEGSRRSYYAPAGFLDRKYPDHDGSMRIIAPLDPVIWDRKLVQLAFGFEYLWEVYKPAKQRRWGWYVCPLLHDGEFVARIEARALEGELVVDNLWLEDSRKFDETAYSQCLERHGRQL